MHSPEELDALLLRHLGQVVPRRTRVKAHEYFASGAVDLHEATGARVVATVQGGERYRVALECRQVAGEGRWYGSCSCPAFGRFGPCKHLYAAALEAAQRGLIGGDGRAAAPRADEPTGWRRALADTAERFARSRRDPWLGVVAHARLVYSLVDRAGRAGLEVRTSDAAALPTGVDWRRLGDELDRAVLARLSGDAGTQLGEVIALDAARAEAVLPLLARAGRLEFAGETLRHSDGGAVQLALRLEPRGADVVLAAGLVHDDEWCELEDNGAWPAIGFAVAEDRLVRLSARASDAAVDVRDEKKGWGDSDTTPPPLPGVVMRVPVVRLIAVREIRDLLRDRRTVMLILVMPAVLYPFFGLAAFLYLESATGQRTVIGVAGTGDRPPPGEPPFPSLVTGDAFTEPEPKPGADPKLAATGTLVVVPVGDAAEAVRTKAVDAAIVVPAGVFARPAGGDKPVVKAN